MNLSALSLKNPIPAYLLFAVSVVLGIISFNRLSIQQYPDIEMPAITVSLGLEGATPVQMESEVAKKIEPKLAALEDVDAVRTTLNAGRASITVTFDIDKDIELALNEVRSAVDSVKSDLPPGITSPVVSKVTTTGAPVITFAVSSAKMEDEQVSWFIDNEVQHALMAVPGVGQVSRIGGSDREIRIELDPRQIDALGIQPAEVSSRLKQVQREDSGGNGEVGGVSQAIRTEGLVESAAQLADLPIPLASGTHVRLGDIATVRDTVGEKTASAVLNGKGVVGFQVNRTRGASDVEVARLVKQAVAKLVIDYPGVKIEEAYNNVDAVISNYQGSMQMLYEGAILTILVVWWFLRDIRATLVAAAALPLSIIPLFAAMYYADFSLNTLTLLATALVIGILVDDAIVETENIVRHQRMGKSPFQAAKDAAAEIGLAVVATSLTIVAVFLPTAFMDGIPGKFFYQFGWTASIAVLVSLAVARLLTPVMAAAILKPTKPHPDPSWLGPYLGLVEWCLAHRRSVAGASILFFIASLALLQTLPKAFVPPADKGVTTIRLEMQPGTTLAEMDAMLSEATSRVQHAQGVNSTFSAAGAAQSGGAFGSTGGTEVRKGSITITLKPREDRERTQPEIEREIRSVLRDLPGVKVSTGGGGNGEKLDIVLASDNSDLLMSTAAQVESEIKMVPGLGGVETDNGRQRQEIRISPDHQRAADLGVTTAALATAIKVATTGDAPQALARLNLPQRQVPIRVVLPARDTLDSIKHIRVPGAHGAVLLESVAHVALSSGPVQINRYNQQQQVTITVSLAGRPIGEVLDIVKETPTMANLPQGVSHVPAGESKRMAEMFSNFGVAILTGIFLVYLVTVVLFNSFVHPVTILSALPLSLGGAVIALLIGGHSFSMPVVIGVLMLLGIVTKNSILLVEYAITANKSGLSHHEAILDACKKRARPIIMTTMAMVAGMLPVAFGLGADPSFRSPMAVAVIGGVITSTALSLLVVPAVYALIAKARRV